MHFSVRIAPLLTRSCYKPFKTVLIEYDACYTGGAAVYSAVTDRLAENFAHLNARMADTRKQAFPQNAPSFGDLKRKLAARLPLSQVGVQIKFKGAPMRKLSLEWIMRSAEPAGKPSVILGDILAVV